MRIQGAMLSKLNRNLNLNIHINQKSLERLSSGYKINKAADDAAGLAISEKLKTQYLGLHQANKNVQDGISLIQTTESGYSIATDFLQRMRSLAVQAANDTLTNDDRSLIQEEVTQLLSEIDRMQTTIQFNGIQVLKGTSEISNTEIEKLKQYLNDHWVAVGQQMVNDTYALGGVGGPMDIIFESGATGGVLAYVQSAYSGGNLSTSLYIELADFIDSNNQITYPNGGTAPYYNDRIITHEMVHATQAWYLNPAEAGVTLGNNSYFDLPTWYKEGTAEYVHGANDRVRGDMWALGGLGLAQANLLVQTDIANWVSSSRYYSAAYEAIMFMDATYGGNSALGNGGQVSDDILINMRTNNMSFDAAIDLIDGVIGGGAITDAASFLAEFNNSTGAGGWANTVLTHATVDYPNDVGGWQSLYAVGQNAADTVDDFQTPGLGAYTITGYTNNFNSQLALAVGANKGQSIDLNLSQISTASLGIDNISLNSRQGAEAAISAIDSALNTISSARAQLGAMQNQLEKTFEFNAISYENQLSAESRIRDTDFSDEMVNYTKTQILTQSSQTILSQANNFQRTILQLLNI